MTQHHAQTEPLPTDVVIAYVTTPPPEAEALARSIIESQRAACVNILPAARSIYRWEGAIEEDEETLLVIKTTAAGLNGLIAHVHEHHSYDTPEVIAVPVVGGAPAYLDWVRQHVDASGSMP